MDRSITKEKCPCFILLYTISSTVLEEFQPLSEGPADAQKPPASLYSLTFTCQPAAEQPETSSQVSTDAEDVAAIRSSFSAYVAAFNTGEANALPAFFTDDAIWLPPNAPAIVGREAIRSFVQNNNEQFTEELTAEVVEADVAGDWAFLRMTYGATMTPKTGGESMELSGKWVNIWRRQPDGSWKIYREIWNTNQPMPGTS